MKFVLAAAAAGALLLWLAAWYMTSMPGHSHRGPLPPLDAGGRELAARLRAHVIAIASEEHNVGRPKALERTALYLEQALARDGHTARRQEFVARGVPVRNLEVAIGGGAGNEALVVVGAHYDSALGAVGANDNGSGAAAAIELARLLKEVRPAPGIELRIVLYVNEEMPWFSTEAMGSNVHAAQLERTGRRVAGMLSLETLGYYSDEPGSQRYPAPFGLLYPRTGNFVAFVGSLAQRGFTRRVVASFRRHAAFPSEGGALPESVPGVDWSDHWSYWRRGWPAVMVTDTALYRYPWYHTMADTPDRVDYERLARVVAGLEHVVRELVGAPRR